MSSNLNFKIGSHVGIVTDSMKNVVENIKEMETLVTPLKTMLSTEVNEEFKQEGEVGNASGTLTSMLVGQMPVSTVLTVSGKPEDGLDCVVNLVDATNFAYSTTVVVQNTTNDDLTVTMVDSAIVNDQSLVYVSNSSGDAEVNIAAGKARTFIRMMYEPQVWESSPEKTLVLEDEEEEV